MGSRSRPGLECGLPKPASLTSAGLLPPSQSLSTLMCTIKWLCLHSQKLTRLGSLWEGSSTSRTANFQSFFISLVANKANTFGQYLMIIWYASRSLTKALGTGSVYSHNPMREILLRPILMSESWHEQLRIFPKMTTSA